MRAISTALKSAQQSASVKPYIHIFLTGNDGNHYDYSHRLIQLEHHEEPYNDWANIYLYDNDRGVASLKGSWIEIGYGCILSDGDADYSDTSRLWVTSTELTSREGYLVMRVHCEGMWSILRSLDIVTKGEPPYYDGQYDEEYTIYDTISDILSSLGFTLAALSQDDGIIDDFCPQVWLNQSPFENPAEVIYRLVAMTKCFLRSKASLGVEVKFPQDSDSVDENYSYNSPHYFHEYREVINQTMPNCIVVYANPGEDGLWTDLITVFAKDEDSIATNSWEDGIITKYHIAMDIDNETDALNRASAILTRIMFEELSGRVIVPHDCRVELYDRVAIYDER
jgi:hypothetical protein